MPERQPFTKAGAAEQMSAAVKTQRSSVDRVALKRLVKSQATSPQGMMRIGDKIIEEGRSQTAGFQTNRIEGVTYAEQRCLTIDPNAYSTRFPFDRVENPHGARKRRLPGWTDCRFILPRVTLEGLRVLTIQLAREQENSNWAAERCRYPRTKNFYIVWALNQLFEQLGFGEFCVPEQNPAGRRVRRFVAKS
jgi:hypothetical protein